MSAQTQKETPGSSEEPQLDGGFEPSKGKKQQQKQKPKGDKKSRRYSLQSENSNASMGYEVEEYQDDQSQALTKANQGSKEMSKPNQEQQPSQQQGKQGGGSGMPSIRLDLNLVSLLTHPLV